MIFHNVAKRIFIMLNNTIFNKIHIQLLIRMHLLPIP